MAYSQIGTVSVGAPVTKDLWDKVDANFGDHEDRINALEAGSNKVDVFNDAIFNASNFNASTTITGYDYKNVRSDFTLTTAELTIITAGSSGTAEIDVLVSTDGIDGPYTSVFSTKPSVAYTAGNNATSTNQVITTTSIAAGSWLRLDITAFQVPTRSMHWNIYGDLS